MKKNILRKEAINIIFSVIEKSLPFKKDFCANRENIISRELKKEKVKNIIRYIPIYKIKKDNQEKTFSLQDALILNGKTIEAFIYSDNIIKVVIRKMLQADDDWCPCYPNNMVQLKVIYDNYTLRQKKSKYFSGTSVITLVAGMDDMGYSKYPPDNYDNDIDYFSKYTKDIDTMPEVVNVDYFVEHGFEPW